MLISFQLTSIELDFSGMPPEATPTQAEQEQLNQQQLDTPVEVWLDESENYSGDDLIRLALDEISNRTGWCVADCAFA